MWLTERHVGHPILVISTAFYNRSPCRLGGFGARHLQSSKLARARARKLGWSSGRGWISSSQGLFERFQNHKERYIYIERERQRVRWGDERGDFDVHLAGSYVHFLWIIGWGEIGFSSCRPSSRLKKSLSYQ